ncbi:zinc finger protein [Loa loa]|uniref:Zinc finger protein n=1 Tax=Loa loa TaxID=7209 RepID=A0A1S0TIM6_LOALO|nr:zinc finger protein [Loa loa]EFO14326.2 zinc finger protein [Loa loa]
MQLYYTSDKSKSFVFSMLIYLGKHLPEEISSLRSCQTCETDNFILFDEVQTEQTELLDLPVPGNSEERIEPLGLSVQGGSGSLL